MLLDVDRVSRDRTPAQVVAFVAKSDELALFLSVLIAPGLDVVGPFHGRGWQDVV